MTITEQLQRRIHEAQSNRQPLTLLTVTESEARLLSQELARLAPFASDPAPFEIFDSMISGTAKFMDLPIKVTLAPSGLFPGALNRVISVGFRNPREGENPYLGSNEILDDLVFKPAD